MAVRMTKLVQEGIDAGNVSADLLPDRVTLLAPYWSTDAKSYLSNIVTGAPSTITSLTADTDTPSLSGRHAQVENNATGRLVAFSNSLGTIAPRAVTANGAASGRVLSHTPGEAQLTVRQRVAVGLHSKQ